MKLRKLVIVKIILIVTFLVIAVIIKSNYNVNHSYSEEKYDELLNELELTELHNQNLSEELTVSNEYNNFLEKENQELQKKYTELIELTNSSVSDKEVTFFIQAESSETLKYALVDECNVYSTPSLNTEPISNVTGEVLVYNVVQTIEGVNSKGFTQYKEWAIVESLLNSSLGNHIGFIEYEEIRFTSKDEYKSDKLSPAEYLGKNYLSLISSYGDDYDFRKNEFGQWYIIYEDESLVFYIKPSTGSIIEYTTD